MSGTVLKQKNFVFKKTTVPLTWQLERSIYRRILQIKIIKQLIKLLILNNRPDKRIYETLKRRRAFEDK